MRPRPLALVLNVICWGLFALAIAWPTVALVLKSAMQGEPPADGFTFSPRQLILFWRSCWLAGLATIACTIVSLPAAFMLGRSRRLAQRPLLIAALAALLLCPPVVYAFGWERVLPTAFNPYIRCVGVWALWAWPIPAMLIGTGWSRVGRVAYEAAVTDSPPLAAFFHIALPLMAKFVTVGMLVVFTLFVGNYDVPHACGLRVYATELLGWAASSSRTIDTAWPAIPGVGVTALALIAGFVMWRRSPAGESGGEVGSTPPGGPVTPAVFVAGLLGIGWVLPVGTLLITLGSTDAFVKALSVYGRDLLSSLAVAGAAGVLVVAMGAGIAAAFRLRTGALIWAVMFAAIPGALVGEALVAAYNHGWLWWLYDCWPIVVLSNVARFGWIGILVGVAIVPSSRSELAAQASTDGATHAGIVAYIHIASSWPAVLCGAAVVGTLSLAEVAAVSLVRVPSFAPISLVIIEKFHRFEDGMLISLSLCLVAASLPAVFLLIPAIRRSNST